MRISNKRIREVLTELPGTNPISRYQSKSEAQAPCKPALQFDKRVETPIPAITGSSNGDVYQNATKYTTSGPLRVSSEQRRRIVHRYLELGHSLRRISREEKRARQTVTRIIRNAPETRAAEKDFGTFQQQMRREFRGMAGKAFKGVARAMKKDWRVAARWFDMAGITEKRRRR